jgi:CubicO group peptidase (beta-lactamase class C family)
MTNLQKDVQEAIDRLVESGAETGLQVAVYQHGELVVDAVAGVADPATGRPVTSDTPFYSASTGKGVTATVAHVLAERGLFNYNTPVAELWPEFGAHGKETVTVRHALSHSAGVPGVPSSLTPEDLGNWDKMVATIAEEEPWWEAGTKTGYHAVSWGFIIGEIVRRASGKPISQVLREEVAGPLGVADELFLGVPESELGRLARLEQAEGTAEMFASLPPDLPMFRAAPPALLPSADYGNRTDVLTSDIPAGGTMTARGVARMYAALLGEVDGVRLVSPERLREISTVVISDVDQVFGSPATWALGYGIGRPGSTPEDSPTTFGMVGMGGSAAYADTATGIAFALTKTRFNPTESEAANEVSGIVNKTTAGV